MGIDYAELQDYLREYLPPRRAPFTAMEELAAERQFPIVGPLVGRLLALLTRLVGARCVLDMGSGFGYSACWFATALPAGGKVTCIEQSNEDAAAARRNLSQANPDVAGEVLVGDALALIDDLPGPFDIIFIDVEKSRYPLALRRALPKLKVGGLLLADNLLWLGNVLTGGDPERTEGIREFTRLLYAEPTLHTTIIPLRDGVSVSLKSAS